MGTSRVLLGPLGGGAYGLKVSRAGYDVTTALVDEQLSFDSRWLGAMRLKASGTFTGSGSAGQTISFGMTFATAPVFLLFSKSGSTYQGHFSTYDAGTGGLVIKVELSQFSILSSGFSGTFTWFAFLP